MKHLYADLCRLPEDNRIAVIVDGLKLGKQVSVIVESEKIEKGKARRYAEKIRMGYRGRVNIMVLQNIPDDKLTTIICKPLGGQFN